MLTVEKLKILLQCNWDEDLFARAGSPSQQAFMAGIELGKYASLLQDLTLISKKLVSPEYARIVHQQLVAACADEATTQTFIGYASTL
jgi:hypothetical protein